MPDVRRMPMRAEERAQKLLTDAGLLVYAPGQHAGACQAPYVVVHNYGSYPTIQARRLTYGLLMIRCYVPLNGQQAETLAALVSRIKEVMRGMRDQARRTGQESPDMIEDGFKALSRSVEYQILKPNKNKE